MRYKVLIVDDEESIVELLSEIAISLDLTVIMASNGQEAVNKAFTEHPDLIFMDIYMPIMDGLQALETIKEAMNDMLIVLITAFGTVDIAIKAIQKGAFEYLVKPSDVSEIREVFRKAISVIENRNSEIEYKPSQNIVGISADMQNIFKTVSKIAKTDASVLITGESGSGKQLVAETIHRLSNRKDKPFIQTDCGSIPDTLLESELFGHVKGAFTGAVESKTGRFELANNGTIFLDEIGELPYMAQAKLLRVLQEKEIVKLGGSKHVKLDVRVVAATNRDLAKMVENKTFRLDLYHRLRVIHIYVPPLRERIADIPLLIDHFVNFFAEKHGKRLPKVSDMFYKWAVNNRWEGNTRELKNLIERMVLLQDGVIDVNNFAHTELIIAQENIDSLKDLFIDGLLDMGDLKQIMSLIEKNVIDAALKKGNQNRSNTAKMLGISRRSLQYKLKEGNEPE